MSLWNWDTFFMNNSEKNSFSNNFTSLQMQLKTLFEDAGGNSTIKFLDLLSQLGEEEKRLVLAHFNNVITKILAGNLRLTTQSDIEKSEFENALYSDLIDAIQNPQQFEFKLELVHGKKGILEKKNNVVELKNYTHDKLIQ